MSKPIKDVTLEFCCDKNWEAMHPNEKGRHCLHCNKTVIDFTTKSNDDLLSASIANNTTVCGRFTIDQVSKRTLLSNSIAIASVISVLELTNFVLADGKQNKPPTIMGIISPSHLSFVIQKDSLLYRDKATLGPITANSAEHRYVVLPDNPIVVDIRTYLYNTVAHYGTPPKGTYSFIIRFNSLHQIISCKRIKGSKKGFATIQKALYKAYFKHTDSLATHYTVHIDFSNPH